MRHLRAGSPPDYPPGTYWSWCGEIVEREDSTDDSGLTDCAECAELAGTVCSSCGCTDDDRCDPRCDGMRGPGECDWCLTFLSPSEVGL